ncbi:MAG: PAC2 family protein [Candidatus Bathyarchaeia archaeon]
MRRLSIVKVYERPYLNDPILIEGLPGIGLVANIAVAFLIKKLGAKIFCEIRSPYFHDMAITNGGGSILYPSNQLYYYKGGPEEKDLVLLYGNTQALTSRGQYELCGRILDIVESLGCKFVITLGGYRPGRTVTRPKIYFAASDSDMAEIARRLGAEPLEVNIFGVAGILVGLCRLRGMRGLCLLAETPGTYPDREAASEILKALSIILRLKIDPDEIGDPKDLISVLPPFDFGALAKKREEKARPEWFV